MHENPRDVSCLENIAGSLELFVVQPTSFCNLDCSYCYLPNRDSSHVMSDAVLAKTFERLFTTRFLGSEVSIVWHAGEPLSVSIAFYEKALALIENLNIRNHKIRHHVQTNGTAINQNWCSFLKRHNFQIGISIDGPAFIHDSHRVRRSGAGTHINVMRGVELLRSADSSSQCII